MVGIRTMSIVEKVSWENVFPLEGGGYLHLKLNFMLSQQEQTRIRAMREAAMKAKQGSINARDLGTTISVSPIGPSSSQAEQTVSDLQTISGLRGESLNVSVQTGSLLKPQPDFIKEERSKPSKEFPKDIDNKDGAGSNPSVQGAESHTANKTDSQSSLHSAPIKSVSSQEVSSKQGLLVSVVASTPVSSNVREDQVEKPEQLGPRGKNFSKVKKIASAFESGLPQQDVKYPLNPSAVKSGSKKVRKGDHPTDASEKSGPNSGLVTEGSKAYVERANNEFSAESYVGNVESQTTSTSKQSKLLASDPRIDDTGREENGKSSGYSHKSSTNETTTTPATEQSTSAVSDANEDFVGTEETGMPTENSDRSLISETATTPGRKHDCHSENVHLSVKKQYSDDSSKSERKRRKDSHSTNDKSISPEYIEEDLFLMGKSEVESCQDNKNFNIPRDPIEHETNKEKEKEKDNHKSEDTRKSRSESPSNDASSGLVGQVVKVAVIVGFGVLVLLTRQRQPRKTTTSNKLEDIDIFKSAEYR